MTQLSIVVSLVILALGGDLHGEHPTGVRVVLRTPEIGLRRAVGARWADIFPQLLGETAALGLLRGTLGTALGVVVTVTVSLANRWVPVLGPAIPTLAIVAGAVAGIIAGHTPALRATRITPAHALSRYLARCPGRYRGHQNVQIPEHFDAARRRLLHLDAELDGVAVLTAGAPVLRWRASRLNAHYVPGLRIAELSR